MPKAPYDREIGKAILRKALKLLEDNVDNIGAIVVSVQSSYDNKIVHPDGETSDGFTISQDLERTGADDAVRLGIHITPTCRGLAHVCVARMAEKSEGSAFSRLFGH